MVACPDGGSTVQLEIISTLVEMTFVVERWNYHWYGSGFHIFASQKGLNGLIMSTMIRSIDLAFLHSKSRSFTNSKLFMVPNTVDIE